MFLPLRLLESFKLTVLSTGNEWNESPIIANQAVHLLCCIYRIQLCGIRWLSLYSIRTGGYLHISLERPLDVDKNYLKWQQKFLDCENHLDNIIRSTVIGIHWECWKVTFLSWMVCIHWWVFNSIKSFSRCLHGYTWWWWFPNENQNNNLVGIKRIDGYENIYPAAAATTVRPTELVDRYSLTLLVYKTDDRNQTQDDKKPDL